MIAEVYPLKRLPRKMKFFDYRVPKGMNVDRGCFVRISVRKKEYWGIVRRVKDKPPRGIRLKLIIRVSDELQLREEELSFFEFLAKDLTQSVSSVLYAALPTPPKRDSRLANRKLSWLPLTLPSSEAKHVIRVVKQIKERGKAFVQVSDIRRSIALILGYLQQDPDQKILILAPSVRDVDLIRRHLTGHEPFIITGSETNNERFRMWREFRESKQGVMVGTRTALLSLDENLSAIFVLRSGDASYKQMDRNPRYDARELVWELKERFHLNLFLFDVSPRPSDLHRLQSTERLTWGSTPTYQVLDIFHEQMSSPKGAISYSAHRAISTCVSQGQRALCILNKKGYARRVQCFECGHRFSCPQCQTALTPLSHVLECARCHYTEPLALRCPTCKSSEISKLGHGNVRVVEELSAQFPHQRVAFLDKEHPDDHGADILVVTQYYFEHLFDPFKKPQFGAVIHLDADTPLYSTDPRAVEMLLRDVWQWAWFAYHHRASYYVQTASQDLVSRGLAQPFRIAEEELGSRMQFALPPAYRWCRVTFKESEKRRAEIAINQLRGKLTRIEHARLHEIEWTSEGHPRLDVGIPSQFYPQLRDIFTGLDDQYIIDTNVFS